MAKQAYNTSTPRIGKIKGEILAHAVPKTALGISGDQKKIGKNMGDTVVYRRWLPVGASNTGAGAEQAANINRWTIDPTDHLVTEGTTPEAETMVPMDVTVQLQQYAVLYSYTDKTADLYEDKIPTEMKMQTGERMGLLREMIDYGALKGCTNKYYAGGTGRGTVNAPISIAMLRKATKGIKGNRGTFSTKVLGSGPNYNTVSVEQGYIVYAHTDCENDIRELANFKEASTYARREMIHECEIGSCEGFRFIITPELGAIADSGASVGSGFVSTSGSNNDVYPYIVCAKDFWANVALRGKESFDVIHVPCETKDKSDPLGQTGYIGAKFYSAAFVQNDGWGAIIEAGSTDI